MIIESIRKIFRRDLDKLKQEVALYSSEPKMWLVEKAITNSGGNLSFHLVGNLKHFIGSQIGATGYVRQRDMEFSSKNISREKLLNEINETIKIVEHTLKELSDEDLEKEYPIIVFKKRMTTGYFLIHLTTHLSYHLGQINYHRRLLDA